MLFYILLSIGHSIRSMENEKKMRNLLSPLAEARTLRRCCGGGEEGKESA
jgi:hypothetical protein